MTNSWLNPSCAAISIDVCVVERRPQVGHVVVQRPGPDRGLGDLEVLALVGDPLVGQGELDDVPHLFEPLARLGPRYVQGLVLAAGDATADAHPEAPALEQVVEHRDAVREGERLVPRQDDDARAHVDPLGLAGPV